MKISDLADIQTYLAEKLKGWENERFLLKGKGWDHDEIIYFDDFIECLSEIVEQHLCDEDFNWGDEMIEIDEKQYDKWISEFDVPEPECPRCGGSPGCNYCLMTGY